MKTTNSEELDFQWYGVKVLYKYLIVDKPNIEKIDENYEEHQIFEESILLIKAPSFDQAYEIAEKKAKEYEDSYINVYDQTVNFQLIESLDAFLLCEEDELPSGTEVYSRFLHIPKEASLANVLSRHYPEVMENETEQIQKNFILRNRDFN
ncbi:DUF4288 domain-containing protein [Bacillus megaterium]|uniref:DUF4288 domain-containing protein n=1 Tax=Priestia megaterium TaxID=1404 RepID=UPI0012937ACD|nr:DUF4288 domain-containing protein [Priestia megaterium]MQR85523.1 DUF4288 domain-containing protein [Priestia megaterium]